MPEPKTRTIVRITANTAKRQMPVPTARPASSGFRAPILRLPPADPLPHQNGDPHGKAGNNHGYGLHQHTAAAYAGDIFRMGELSHHQQIDTAVQGLKKQRQKYGQRETDQGAENFTFCKTM